MSSESHVDGCGCQWCRQRRSVECITTGAATHPDHRLPDCPSSWKPSLGDTATCSTCRRAITWKHVEEPFPGCLPRTDWSDGWRVDEIVCFRAVDYRHVPDVWPIAPRHQATHHREGEPA